MGEWLQRLGLERYEQGLLHNGWDDLEFLRYTHARTHTRAHMHTRSPTLTPRVLSLSDITEEDLEEAGVLDHAHKRILLESLRQQQELK